MKKIQILFPRNSWQGHKINVDFDKFLSFVNPSLEQIKIMVGFEKDKLKLATTLFDGIINSYKNIKYIELDVDCLNAPENKNEYSNEENSPYQKEIKKREKNAKNPVYVDFRKLLNLKELETVSLNLDENVGTRLLNVNEIINHKNLKDIRIDKDKFDTKDLEKMFEIIGTPRENICLNITKKILEKQFIIRTRWMRKVEKEYNEIEEVDENTIEIDGSYLLNILVDRYKKNEKNTK